MSGEFVRRCDMQPGTIFGVSSRTEWRGYCVERRDALVVLDRYTEVSLWTGAKSVWGDVAGGLEFEVL